MLLINRTGRGVSQKERPPKVTTTKIRIVIRSFDHPFLENHFWGLPPYTRKIGLPESRVLYTVLRSPHIDKKSREQFEIKKRNQYLVIKTERHELRKKFFRLKRQRIFGAQYEILFSYKTRSDKGKLKKLL
jgi:small subunit ribosomal protein S10|uniref:ribosomal protein S10 n=1 Tax=Kandelia obovata TaxID=413952 RepID=UPI0022DCD8D0|nr:ribosomal protein S10 [Kandelia obovata]UZU71467.1 ribosomal protein S10 [Kandelia obovata]